MRVLDRRHLSGAEAASLDGACTPDPSELELRPTGASRTNEPGVANATLPPTGAVSTKLAAAGVAALLGGVIAIRRGKHRTGQG